MNSSIIAPVVALVAWTLVIMVWMYATRLPAMRRKGIALKGRVGSEGRRCSTACCRGRGPVEGA